LSRRKAIRPDADTFGPSPSATLTGAPPSTDAQISIDGWVTTEAGLAAGSPSAKGLCSTAPCVHASTRPSGEKARSDNSCPSSSVPLVSRRGR